VTISVGGQTGLAAINNGDGTWALLNGALMPLTDGVYNVTATATDALGNIGADASTGELAVDTLAPTVTVHSLVTNDPTPALTGTINDPTATILIGVAGQVGLAAVNHGDGTWTLPDNTLAALADGAYDVAVTATDALGNAGADGTAGELFIDATPPAVTVNSLATNDATPALAGTVDDPAATVTVSVGAQIGLAAVNHGDGTWTLPDNALAALADGTYNVIASATDGLGNVGVDATTDELTIATSATFANTTAITVMGTGTPYPSTITVAGLSGVVQDVNVTLHELSHLAPDGL
jgi:hypothetical protein